MNRVLIHDENKELNNKKAIIALIIPLTILCKFFQFTVLPEKYFYDSYRIIYMTIQDNSIYAWGGSYEIVADLFKKINILNFNTLQDWAYSLAFIFIAIIIFMISRFKKFDISQCIFIICSIGLLNIYVFNISKDIVQYGFFCIMYIIIIQKKLPSFLKIILCFAVFYWESSFFRSYYILMGAFFIILYLIISIIKRKNIKINKVGVLKIILIIFVSVYLLLFISQYISPDDYNKVINIREENLNEMAVSQIENWVTPNGTLNIFMINYIINAIRMMIPIELLFKGVFYVPFVFYQIFILYYMIKTIKHIGKKDSSTLIAFCAFCGFLLGSFVFEPDFGSFVRHESAAFPLFHLIALNENN